MLTRAMICLSLFLMSGCGSSQTAKDKEAGPKNKKTADPHEKPLTKAEIDKVKADTAKWSVAIEHIQKYRDTIKSETTTGSPEKAHHALDLVEIVLKRLPEIAQSNNVPKENWEAVGTSVQALRTAFDGIHAKIDDGKPADYAAVSGDIDAAVNALAAIKPAPASK